MEYRPRPDSNRGGFFYGPPQTTLPYCLRGTKQTAKAKGLTKRLRVLKNKLKQFV